jgi:hypothetical protein
LNETYSEVHIGKHLSDTFPIKNRLKEGVALKPFLFSFALEYTIRKVRENHVGLKRNKGRQLLFYADNVNTIKKNTKTLIDASKEVGLEVNTEKTKHMLMSRHQNAGDNRNIKTSSIYFQNVAEFKYLGRAVTN